MALIYAFNFYHCRSDGSPSHVLQKWHSSACMSVDWHASIHTPNIIFLCSADLCWSKANLSQYPVHPSHWTVVGNCGTSLKSHFPQPAQLYPCLCSYIASCFLQPAIWPTQYGGMQRRVINCRFVEWKYGVNASDFHEYKRILSERWTQYSTTSLLSPFFSGAGTVSGAVWRGFPCQGPHQQRKKKLLWGSDTQSGFQGPCLQKESRWEIRYSWTWGEL